jgi:hypothetical protein
VFAQAGMRANLPFCRGQRPTSAPGTTTMNENPYASPKVACDVDAGAPKTARWQSIRVGLAISCFTFAAMFILLAAVGFLIQWKASLSIALCAMLGVAFALAGLALLAIPWLLAIAVRLARSRFR